jgi:diaminopimelate epimerase
MTAVIPFIKASAYGNDFLIVENAPISSADFSELTRRMCDRHNGIGADGVEWLFPHATADVHARLFNADGSEAEISGNGTRCAAAFLSEKANHETISVQTGAGLKTCKLISHKQQEYEFEIGMGKPDLGDKISIPIAFREITGLPVSMGNPHLVCFEKELPAKWQSEGAEIQRSSFFVHGVNVEFVVVQDQSNVAVRFFERGVGETQSSGTGSCAAAVAAISVKKAQSPVRVHAVGGTQTVRWDDEVFLTGTARLLFRGEFFL